MQQQQGGVEQSEGSSRGWTVVASGGDDAESVPVEGDRRVRKKWMVVEPNSAMEITINDDDEEIDLIACQLSEMEELAPFTRLHTLLLRQNLLEEAELERKLASASPTLRRLDLYENRITAVTFAAGLGNLEYLDLSCNGIKDISHGLESLVNCTELYLTANKIKTIDGLSQCTSLITLELGCNRLRTIENLGPLPHLRELWLAKNKITEIANLDHVGPTLTKLSLQSNRLTVTTNLSNLTNLVELYLSENGLTDTTGVESLHNLKVLDFASNQITTVSNLTHLTQLEDLWLDNNSLDASFVNDMGSLLPRSPVFDTLRVERNQPLCKAVPAQTYRRLMLQIWPTLDQIDSTSVSSNERQHAASLIQTDAVVADRSVASSN